MVSILERYALALNIVRTVANRTHALVTIFPTVSCPDATGQLFGPVTQSMYYRFTDKTTALEQGR